MDKLIIGGIYLTEVDNFMVIINKSFIDHYGECYCVAFFDKNQITQKGLQTITTVSKDMYRLSWFKTKDHIAFNTFCNSGYCGKITKELLCSLNNKFLEKKDAYFHV